MLVSLNWIKKFTDLKFDDQELIIKIGSQIAEVESVVDLSAKYSGILVAEIIEANDHPEADKLGIYQLSNGQQTIQVVAGDKTLKVGDKVAYIPPGSVVPASFGTDQEFVIEARELRGEMSNGMMASQAELDWGDDHSGVLRLDADMFAGTSLIEAYELNDKIIEIENKTLTHRPDCFGVIGFARELAGVNGIKFSAPSWFNNATESQNNQSPSDLSVVIETSDCSRYVGIVMDGVNIGPSPLLVQSYLSRVGVRPINNIVDITNYLMIETGQPLHAFDYDKITKLSAESASIVVRNPRENEKLTLLDGREIQPHSNATLICTDQKPIALAGAMGGAETEIDEHTTKIIIESASFDLYSLRKTSMIHGVLSEAVTRFIRGQSPDQCLAVAMRAAEMSAENAGASVVGRPVDVYPNPLTDRKIIVDSAFINSRLGSELTAQQIGEMLDNVELSLSEKDEHIEIIVPFWRRDLLIAEDIVEEIGRLNGYDNLRATLPSRDLRAAKLNDFQKLIIDIRQTMVNAGNNELLTYNFVAENDLNRAKLNVDIAYKLRNSISPKLQVMRTALLPSLIDKVHPNIKLGYRQFGLFEINKSHRNNNVVEDLPVEEHSLAYVFAADGKTKTEAVNGSAYYQASKMLTYLLDELGIPDVQFRSPEVSQSDWVDTRINTYMPGRVAIVKIKDEVFGLIGEIDSTVKKNFKLPDYCAGFELDIVKILKLKSHAINYVPQNRYPGTQKDVTLIVKDDVRAADILEAIEIELNKMPDMNNDVQLIDIFQQEQSTKNLTFRLQLTHDLRTLTTEEANTLVDSVVKNVSHNYL